MKKTINLKKSFFTVLALGLCGALSAEPINYVTYYPLAPTTYTGTVSATADSVFAQDGVSSGNAITAAAITADSAVMEGAFTATTNPVTADSTVTIGNGSSSASTLSLTRTSNTTPQAYLKATKAETTNFNVYGYNFPLSIQQGNPIGTKYLKGMRWNGDIKLRLAGPSNAETSPPLNHKFLEGFFEGQTGIPSTKEWGAWHAIFTPDRSDYGNWFWHGKSNFEHNGNNYAHGTCADSALGGVNITGECWDPMSERLGVSQTNATQSIDNRFTPAFAAGERVGQIDLSLCGKNGAPECAVPPTDSRTRYVLNDFKAGKFITKGGTTGPFVIDGILDADDLDLEMVCVEDTPTICTANMETKKIGANSLEYTINDYINPDNCVSVKTTSNNPDDYYKIADVSSNEGILYCGASNLNNERDIYVHEYMSAENIYEAACLTQTAFTKWDQTLYGLVTDRNKTGFGNITDSAGNRMEKWGYNYCLFIVPGGASGTGDYGLAGDNRYYSPHREAVVLEHKNNQTIYYCRSRKYLDVNKSTSSGGSAFIRNSFRLTGTTGTSSGYGMKISEGVSYVNPALISCKKADWNSLVYYRQWGCDSHQTCSE